MTWREVLEKTDQEGFIDVLERLKELGLDGEAYNLADLTCRDDASLAAFADAGGEAADPDRPTWEEVLAVTDVDIVDTLEDFGRGGPSSVGDLDERCDDWYDRVGPFQSPEGEAYLEVTELLDSIQEVDSDLYDAARDCFEIIEGSAPGNDFHGVYVNSREDLGILRRILHAADIKVNILVC